VNFGVSSVLTAEWGSTSGGRQRSIQSNVNVTWRRLYCLSEEQFDTSPLFDSSPHCGAVCKSLSMAAVVSVTSALSLDAEFLLRCVSNKQHSELFLEVRHAVALPALPVAGVALSPTGAQVPLVVATLTRPHLQLRLPRRSPPWHKSCSTSSIVTAQCQRRRPRCAPPGLTRSRAHTRSRC